MQTDEYFVWGSAPYCYGFETHAGAAFHLAEQYGSGEALCGRRSQRFVTVSVGLDSDRICSQCRGRVETGCSPAPDQIPPGAKLIVS